MEQVTVLVVDDDPSIVEMIRLGLEADDMRVLSAGDGAEALEVLQREGADVVILDIMMPRVDGWMALMEIRNNPLTADIPIIMLTAKTQDLAKILAFKQGVQQYVTKPFNILELAARVRSLAQRRQAAAGMGAAATASSASSPSARAAARCCSHWTTSSSSRRRTSPRTCTRSRTSTSWT